MIGPQDLHVAKELKAICFSRKHPVIPVFLVAGVLLKFGSVDHDCFRKVLEDRRKKG